MEPQGPVRDSEFTAYKLVDRDGYTRRHNRGETLWLPPGIVVRPTGVGCNPCGPGVLHGYISPEVAMLGNPIHAELDDPRLLEVLSSKRWSTDGLKRWTTGECLVQPELPLPTLTVEELVAWAVVLAPHAATREWAVAWLSDRDRSPTAARAAAGAASWAAGAAGGAAEAARAAAWVAMAEAAEAARAAAGAAMRAAWGARVAAAEARLMPALERARAIIAGTFPAEQYDSPLADIAAAVRQAIGGAP